MAKDLPFFKFYVSEWNDGKIVDCSLEAQGLFINLCSLYWSRLGQLDDATAMRRLCHRNATAYKELKKAGVLKVFADGISIEFLDEQLEEQKSKSQKSRENALKRWNHDATAMPPHSDRNAEEKRREEIREEESERREYGPTHENYVIVSANGRKPAARINGKPGLSEYLEAHGSILNQPAHADRFMMANRGKVFNEFTHLWNGYNKWIENQFK